MLQHVRHDDAREARGAERRVLQVCHQRRRLLMPPRQGRRLARKVQAHHAESAPAHHAQKESAAAAYVEQRAAGAGAAQRPFHETDMAVEHRPAVAFFQTAHQAPVGREPVGLGVVAAQLLGRRLRVQPGQAALPAAQERELLSCGPVQPVGLPEQQGSAPAAAHRAFAHVVSFRLSRWARISRRTSPGERRRRRRTAVRLRNMRGSSLSAPRSPLTKAVAIFHLPCAPGK